eukprot:TRINITY_DN14928_c0_g1_i8.p1 TRINITY_DN14928_c0_g1~~TRINITY_DN14928_c0_g1_i8.p1  ORF type:complete len:250 (-),score=38.63 TRINITY_DN14928_c0_g1_i8:200-949(-)
MIRRPPRSTHCISSAASDVYKRQLKYMAILRKRKAILKQLDQGYSTYTQEEANQAFEGKSVDISMLYAHVLRITIYSYSLGPLIPFGTFYSLVALIMLYWVDKYSLIRRCVCKNYFSNQLCKQMMKFVQLMVIFYAISNFLMMILPQYNQEKDEWEIRYDRIDNYLYASIVGIMVPFICHFFPLKFLSISQLYKKKFQDKSSATKKDITFTFEQVKQFLASDYDLFHPVFRDKVLQKIQIQENEKDQQQ